jgi:hypothetical protein
MRLALDLTEEGPEVMETEGEGPISVAGAVIKIGPKFRNGEMSVSVSFH